MKYVLGIGGGIVLCALVVWFMSESTSPEREEDQLGRTAPRLQQNKSEVLELPKGQRIFRSEPFRFSLYIPEALAVEEYSEKGDAYTYVFTDDDGRSFQIYVTPYGKDHIDAEQFLRDQPSGVREEEQQTTIGGVPGVVFGGKNDVMGETREVWFIKDGLLYEVTTYRELDAWLAEIMTSWHFLD